VQERIVLFKHGRIEPELFGLAADVEVLLKVVLRGRACKTHN
jgi:hypothetical protein